MTVKQQSSTTAGPKGELGLKIFVALLFVSIVTGISLVNYVYQKHLLQVYIFNQIKIHEDSRLLELYDKGGGKIVTTAKLGTTLSYMSTPEICTHYLHYLLEHQSHTEKGQSGKKGIKLDKEHSSNPRTEGSLAKDVFCLDWAYQAQLQLWRLPPEGNVQCFNIQWFTSDKDKVLTDCIQMPDKESAIWWGGGELREGGFPLDTAREVDTDLFLTGELSKHPWGHLLRHTFVSSYGSFIMLPEHLPFKVSINHPNVEQFCISLKAGNHSIGRQLAAMNYTLCTSPNITSVLNYLHKKAAINKPPEKYSMDINEQKKRVIERLEQPVWRPWLPPENPYLTKAAVLKYVDDVLNINGQMWGHILLPSSWQSYLGDLVFDPLRFPDAEGMVRKIERKGFHMALTISSLVASNTETFKNGTLDGLWVRQTRSPLPALTQATEATAAAVIDFTNPRASDWFTKRLSQLRKLYNVNRFHLVSPSGRDLPEFHEFYEPVSNPDTTLQLFIKTVSSIAPPISTSVALVPPYPPTFVTLGTAGGGWAALESLVPRVLTLTLLGVPLVDTGVIGGEAGRPGHAPEKELYIRWAEVAVFLPAFQICVLPHIYDQEVEGIFNDLIKLRKDLVLPRLVQRVPDALLKGTPLISPLVLSFPNDPVAIRIDNQWMVGDDILVAPVLGKAERAREIYLPPGIWKDMMDERVKRGRQWLKGYRIPLSKVALFKFISAEEENT